MRSKSKSFAGRLKPECFRLVIVYFIDYFKYRIMPIRFVNYRLDGTDAAMPAAW
jgi:hypothetical protein